VTTEASSGWSSAAGLGPEVVAVLRPHVDEYESPSATYLSAANAVPANASTSMSTASGSTRCRGTDRMGLSCGW
jgi:hypothetical protein